MRLCDRAALHGFGMAGFVSNPPSGAESYIFRYRCYNPLSKVTWRFSCLVTAAMEVVRKHLCPEQIVSVYPSQIANGIVMVVVCV